MSLLGPIITEHSLNEARRSRFTFRVEPGDTKPEIRRAVEKIFSVNVLKIETAAIPAKSHRAGKSRKEVAGVIGKKAVVTLKENQKINLFEFGEGEENA